MPTRKKNGQSISLWLAVSVVVLLASTITLGVLWQNNHNELLAEKQSQAKLSALLGIPELSSLPDRCATQDNSDLALTPVNPVPIDGYFFYAGVCKWKDNDSLPVLFTFKADESGAKQLISNNGTADPWCLSEHLEGDVAKISEGTSIPVCETDL